MPGDLSPIGLVIFNLLMLFLAVPVPGITLPRTLALDLIMVSGVPALKHLAS